MDGLRWKIPFKWMILGCPHFRKPPYAPLQEAQLICGTKNQRMKTTRMNEDITGKNRHQKDLGYPLVRRLGH